MERVFGFEFYGIRNILKKVAAVGKLAAIKAAGAASWADCYQPKEPKTLKKYLGD
ncbi:MAG: cyclic lactone autoinducer peptide [Eubacterium sp.]|nr:cyclic lactone autoinducer peptide [Eubacterium sp.]